MKKIYLQNIYRIFTEHYMFVLCCKETNAKLTGKKSIAAFIPTCGKQYRKKI